MSVIIFYYLPALGSFSMALKKEKNKMKKNSYTIYKLYAPQSRKKFRQLWGETVHNLYSSYSRSELCVPLPNLSGHSARQNLKSIHQIKVIYND